MSSQVSKITIDKLKKTIFELARENRLSVDLSLKFLDHLSNNNLLRADAEKILISLTTLSLTKVEIEKMLTYFLEKKITTVCKQEEVEKALQGITPTKPDLKQIDLAITKEQQSQQFDYREHVYNYLFTMIATIDDDTIHTHYAKIKADVPEISESEFKKILERVIKDNEIMNSPYEGRTQELENTLEIFSAVESDELPAFSSEYVHLIKDPSTYILDNIKTLSLNDLMSPDDEKYYGKMLKSTNPLKRAEAKQKFTLANLRLVMYVVRQFVRYNADLINLFDEGFLGLLKAIQKFDYTLNFRFSTYAIWWIKRAVLRYLQNASKTIRIPAHLVSLVTKLNKLERKLKEQKNVAQINKQTLRAAAKTELKMDDKKFDIVYPLIRNQVEFIDFTPEQIEKLENRNEGSILNEEKQLMEQEELNKIINKLLYQLLTDKEEKIIKRRFGLTENRQKMTLQAIANEFGVSKERIRQIEASAKLKLRSEYVQRTLHSYFKTIQNNEN